MKKDFFLATDTTTQSSNKEENEKENFFFFLVLNEATKGKCRQAQNQENKTKLWLKAQITKNQSIDAQWKSRKHRLLRLSKNHKIKSFSFYLFYQQSTKKKPG
jgi:hypothetical protein